jgi:putative ABC transport system permease protein
MFFLTTKNLWAHKRRMIGTVLAVVLGVAFLSGTLLLSDTLHANFERLFTQAYGSTDVVVRSATKIGDDPRQNRRTGVDAALVTSVTNVSGVAQATPYLEGNGQLLGHDGKAIGGNGPPTRAANWIDTPSLTPYRLAAGRIPRADDEVVINRGAAKTGHLRLGDTTTLLTPAPMPVRIVGISTFGSADGFGPSTFTGLTLHAAQTRLTNNPDQVTEIRVQAASGVAPDVLAQRMTGALPGSVQTITGAGLAAESFNDLNQGFLGFVRNALLVFSIIAVLVAAFSIYNTFSMLAAQRGRETALQRALGATRRQVITAGALEAVAVGAIGSALGLVVGIAFAAGLKGVFAGFGFALPAGGLVFTTSSATIALAAGMAATLAAALLPAVRASDVAPLAVLRDLAVEASGVSRRRALGGSGIAAAGILAVMLAATGSAGPGIAALGGVLTLLGAVALGPVVARPVLAALGAPVAARGITGTLSRDNARRNPRRTAATATSLMVGVAVVALFTVVGASLKASVSDGVGKSLTSDLVVDTAGFGGQSGGTGLSPQLASAIAKVPEVQDAVGIGGGSALLAGSTHAVTVADPDRVDKVLDLGITGGSLAGLSDHGLGVTEQAAKNNHWRVGTLIPVVYPDGARDEVHIAFVYANGDLTGDYLMSSNLWNPHAGQQRDTKIFVNVRPGADVESARAAITNVARPYGAPRVQDRAQFRTSAAEGVNTILGLVYVMLALAIVIAFMGIANTLSLAVYERTRELGLLRAVGQTRRQTRSMVRWESVMIAVFGTLAGVSLGTFLAWALVKSSSSTTLAVFAVPPLQLAVFVVIGALAGVLAAIRPARRAARLHILQAIASE